MKMVQKKDSGPSPNILLKDKKTNSFIKCIANREAMLNTIDANEENAALNSEYNGSAPNLLERS